MKTRELHPIIKKVRFERTFCMVKPDGVARGLIGEIISRIERAGLKVIAIKMTVPSEATIRSHYPASDEAWVHRLGEKSISGFELLDGIEPIEILGTTDRTTLGKEVVKGLIDYMQSGPSVCMVVEGVQAIAMMRKLAGHTLPFKAEVGTIRGDYSVDSPVLANAQKRAIHNLFHASETHAEAEKEIKLWFGGESLHDYQLGNEDTMYSRYY